jgi:hypothetical protein
VTEKISVVYREGRAIEVVEKEPKTPLKQTRRKQFQTEFTMMPKWWIDVLRRSKSHRRTWELASLILDEAFRCEFTGNEIVLSQVVTNGMPRNTKVRAAEELERLGLIRIIRDGNKALRVIIFKKKE